MEKLATDTCRRKTVHVPGVAISAIGAKRIQQKPTTTSTDNSEKATSPAPSSVRRRNTQLMYAARAIHGGSLRNTTALYRGLFASTFSIIPRLRLRQLIANSPTILKVMAQSRDCHVSKYEKSTRNVTRSIAALYRGGIVGKRKYEMVRSSMATFYNGAARSVIRVAGSRVPRLLPYAQLSHHIKLIDIGEVRSLPNVPGAEPVYGRYRPLEWVLTAMAELLLSNKNTRKQLLWFGKPEGTFRYAVGGDGAPFGKSGEATAFCVSLLNQGARVASEKCNFLLCIADCNEEHAAMKAYTRALCQEMEELQRRELTICGVKCSMSPGLIPGDMKWIASVAGELNNAAT